MSLTVKAAYRGGTAATGGRIDEIRRFAVDPDVASNFGYLTRKIGDVFPALRDKAFRLYWKGV